MSKKFTTEVELEDERFCDGCHALYAEEPEIYCIADLERGPLNVVTHDNRWWTARPEWCRLKPEEEPNNALKEVARLSKENAALKERNDFLEKVHTQAVKGYLELRKTAIDAVRGEK